MLYPGGGGAVAAAIGYFMGSNVEGRGLFANLSSTWPMVSEECLIWCKPLILRIGLIYLNIVCCLIINLNYDAYVPGTIDP